MRVLKVLAPLATLALLAATGPALASGDVEAGKKVFNKCKACHDISEGKNKVGPTLKGVMGRTAGTVEGYAYSDAMKASGIVWNEDTLEKYLADPKALMSTEQKITVFRNIRRLSAAPDVGLRAGCRQRLSDFQATVDKLSAQRGKLG